MKVIILTKAIVGVIILACLFMIVMGVQRVSAEDKVITVDSSGTAVAGSTYQTIQAALDYIDEQTETDKSGWTINVSDGTYSAFTV